MRHAFTFAASAIIAIGGALASASPAAAEVSPTATHVAVTLKEMSVQLSTSTVPAGQVVFDITNTGAAEHEFVILKTDIDAAQLPASLDEEGKAAEIGHVDEIDPVASGTTVSLAVTLGPGNYVLVCNKPGHYAAGMRAAFTVATPIAATEKEMSITLGQKFATAGAVAFTITNTGSAVHEFVVLKTDIPEGAIAASSDEPGKAEEPGHVGEAEDIDPGKTKTLTLTLDPGKYVIICNMPGHYAAGMHTSFTVLPGLSRTVKAAIDQANAARGVEDEQALVEIDALLTARGVVVTDFDRAAVASGIVPRAFGADGRFLYGVSRCSREAALEAELRLAFVASERVLRDAVWCRTTLSRPDPAPHDLAMRMVRIRLGASVLAAVVLALDCGAPSGSAPSSQAQPATADTGVSLAENSGPTLVVLSLDPAEPGANTVQIDVHDVGGASISGSVRLDGSLDGAQIVSAILPAAARRAPIAIAHPGRAEFRAMVLDGKGAGATVSFALDVQAAHAPESTLGDIDRAMLSLRTMRETQTLTSGGPPLVFHFEYLAPDRVRYTTLSPTGQLTETRLIGRDRFDREAGGPWTHTDLGFPSRVPFSAYAHDATRLRVIGHDHDGGEDILEFAFVQAQTTYYRLWVGAQDHLVRRYVMMAQGHYMTGAYSDYDATIAIAAP